MEGWVCRRETARQVSGRLQQVCPDEERGHWATVERGGRRRPREAVEPERDASMVALEASGPAGERRAAGEGISGHLQWKSLLE